MSEDGYVVDDKGVAWILLTAYSKWAEMNPKPDGTTHAAHTIKFLDQYWVDSP